MVKGRRRKGPWLRKSDNCWYTNRPGNTNPIRLTEPGSDYQTAWAEFVKYHAQFTAEAPHKITLAELWARLDEFNSVNRSAGTADWYRRFVPSL